MLRHSPEVRPFTYSTREPQTLMPSLVSPATARLKTLVLAPGVTYLVSMVPPDHFSRALISTKISEHYSVG